MHNLPETLKWELEKFWGGICCAAAAFFISPVKGFYILLLPIKVAAAAQQAVSIKDVSRA